MPLYNFPNVVLPGRDNRTDGAPDSGSANDGDNDAGGDDSQQKVITHFYPVVGRRSGDRAVRTFATGGSFPRRCA